MDDKTRFPKMFFFNRKLNQPKKVHNSDMSKGKISVNKLFKARSKSNNFILGPSTKLAVEFGRANPTLDDAVE